MKVSVVIPVYNGAHQLPEQLDSLSGQSLIPDEVLIADNGSSDASRDVALSYCDRLPIRVFDASTRRGNAAARNLGAGAASGDMLLFLDQDDQTTATWVESMTKALAAADVVVGINHMMSSLPLSGSLPPKLLIGSEDKTYRFLPYGLSCNMAVRRAVFEKLNGFDENYRAATDVDLCWRSQVEGYAFSVNFDAELLKRTKQGVRGVFRQHYEFGLDDPLLFRRFRRYGMKRISPLPTYFFLLTRLPFLVLSKGRRGGWVRLFGRSCGRVVGSFTQRTVYL